MSAFWTATAIVGGSVIGGVMSSNAASDAADTAASAQTAASQASIAEQRRQFDALQKLFEPYVNMGNKALASQGNLMGLNGNALQQQAINALQASPQYTSQLHAGENAILQNASATGGLRGGNLENALANFRPQLLAQLINSQFTNLGGLTSIGQNSAAGTGNAGMQSATNIGNLLTQAGSAQANAALASGQANVSAINGISSSIPSALLLSGLGGGGTSAGLGAAGINQLGTVGSTLPLTGASLGGGIFI